MEEIQTELRCQVYKSKFLRHVEAISSILLKNFRRLIAAKIHFKLGQSAGAVLSTAVFLSPLSEGLIHRAIGDSGSAYSIWATNLTPLDDHLRFARFTSCRDIVDEAPTEDDIDFVMLTNCVKNLELGELVKAQEDYSVSYHICCITKTVFNYYTFFTDGRKSGW